MTGNHPKRRKDKYNPYEIYEKDGKYYVSFRNGEKEYKNLEIGKSVYEAFNTFELQDVSHMNVVDRHLEQSEIWDSSLYERIFRIWLSAVSRAARSIVPSPPSTKIASVRSPSLRRIRFHSSFGISSA